MSNPPHITTTPPPQPPPQPPQPLPSLHHHQHLQILPRREYRKGNWTIQETLTLITAKKLNEEYRSSRATTATGGGKLRWNWIEEYCWSNGCYRSQNQCNDKWDNLLRDYKKVRRYQQSRSSPPSALNGSDSYFKMERHERKLHNLPSNMSQEVFEALNEVVQRRSSSSYTTFNNNNNNNTNINIIPLQQQQQEEGSGPLESPTLVAVAAAPPRTTEEVSEEEDSGETEASEKSKSKLKKRRVGKMSSSIKRSGSILAQTLKSCDEMKHKRHQQVMELEQRRLQIEETRNEVNRQGIANFVKAMSNLSDAIHSIISNFNDQT